MSSAGQHRIDSLKPGEGLQLSIELNNPATALAVQILTRDYHVIGWAPRYLVHDLAAAMADSPNTYEAEVVRGQFPVGTIEAARVDRNARFLEAARADDRTEYLPLVPE